MPAIFRTPPRPADLRRTEQAYSRRGRVVELDDPRAGPLRRLPGRPQGHQHRATCGCARSWCGVYADWVMKLDLDGLRIDTLKHVDYGFWEFFAPRGPASDLADAGKDELLHVRRGLRRATTILVGSYTQARPARLGLLLLAEVPGLRRRLHERRPDHQASRALSTSAPPTTGTMPQHRRRRAFRSDGRCW